METDQTQQLEVIPIEHDEMSDEDNLSQEFDMAVATEHLMDKLSELVTQYGPKHLIRGMTNFEAHTAMVACIEKLVEQIKALQPGVLHD